MLTILNDPAGVTGRHRHAWDHAVSIHANIERHLPQGGDCLVAINGVVLADPGTDDRLDRLPSLMDHVVVTRQPQTGLEAIYYWMIAAFVVSVAISLSMRPNLDSSAMAGKDSPNNRLTAQTNIARAYQATPDVYGFRRCWPDLIQPSTVEYVNNVKFVTEWLCISRGKGTISDVRYAETPIGDIDGASWEPFEPVPATPDGLPEFGSTTLHDVVETFPSDDVNGQEIVYPEVWEGVAVTAEIDGTAGNFQFSIDVPDGPELDNLKALPDLAIIRVQGFINTPPDDYGSGGALLDTPCTLLSQTLVGGVATFNLSSSDWRWTYSETGVALTLIPGGSDSAVVGPFTLPIDCDRIRWNTVFLRGLRGAVSIAAEWWRIDGDGEEVPGTRQVQHDLYNADTYDQQFYTRGVTPSGGRGRYRIQFTRLTDKIGDGGSDVAKLEEVYAVRHYPTKVLPGVTVIRVTTKATTEATGYSERKFNLRWLRHVRQLSGDTIGPSRNYGRTMAHIWRLAENDMAELDTAKLAGINAEHGEDSPLLRFDHGFDDVDISLGERMQTVANVARCQAWRDGTRWTVTREQAEPHPTMQLDYRNLAGGTDSVITYAAHLPASNDGVELEYVDEASQSKKAYIRLNVSSGTPVPGPCRNPKKIQLLGCATAAQADNRAQLEARRILFQRISVQDTALADAGALGPLEVIRWIDPLDFGGDDGLQAGEVLEIVGTTIKTSEPASWMGEGSGRIVFTGADGRRLGPPVVCTPSTVGAEYLVLSSVPDGLYVADEDRQCGSRYAFAVGLTADEVEAAGLYRVTAIKPETKGRISLAFSEHDNRMYEAD